MANSNMREAQQDDDEEEKPQIKNGSFHGAVSKRAASKMKKKSTGRRRRIIEEEKGIINTDYQQQNIIRDPFEVLGKDVMFMVLSHLDARSSALCLLISRAWHGVACSDRLWTSKHKELWHGKAHIPRMSQVGGLSKLTAYSLSVMDSKRTRIMKDDLCDHAWEFHFTNAVPEYWQDLDPYWNVTRPLMHRYFHSDGSQTADPGDNVQGGHECCYTIVTPFSGEGNIRRHYVRIDRWPQMSVYRKPDWSWGMSNVLFTYSSIPDAYKEGGTGPLGPVV